MGKNVITFCSCLSNEEISLVGFFCMEIKGVILLKKMKWLRYGGNLLFTILYLWSAELTPFFIKYEGTVPASRVHGGH